jgi:hypothetical protein
MEHFGIGMIDKGFQWRDILGDDKSQVWLAKAYDRVWIVILLSERVSGSVLGQTKPPDLSTVI